MDVGPDRRSRKDVPVRIIAIVDRPRDVVRRRCAADGRRDIHGVTISIRIEVVRRQIGAADAGSKLSCWTVGARLSAVLTHPTGPHRHAFDAQAPFIRGSATIVIITGLASVCSGRHDAARSPGRASTAGLLTRCAFADQPAVRAGALLPLHARTAFIHDSIAGVVVAGRTGIFALRLDAARTPVPVRAARLRASGAASERAAVHERCSATLQSHA